MFKPIKAIPVLALAIATLVPTNASAKVPFRAGERSAENATAYSADAATRTESQKRYRKAGTLQAAPLAVCAHTHRYSGQHRM